MKAKRLILVLAIGVLALNQFAALDLQIAREHTLKLTTLVRGYWMDDQRINWSGLETTFGAEALIRPVVERQLDWGTVRVEGEFLLTQPFGKNILTDDNRQKYRANFEIAPLEISQLNLQVETGAFTFTIGKKVTPFGRTYFPNFLNNLGWDSPFIRSEVVLWRETGLFILFKKGLLNIEIAFATGDEDKDTNSSFAPEARIGLGNENWTIGISGKKHDGIGSEQQKEFKTHFGIDLMLRLGPFQVSAEAIYDEYGLKKNLPDSEINWPRSLYHRNLFHELNEPIIGRGGYINLAYQRDRWLANLNYGEYDPEKIDNPYHDEPIRRGIASIYFEAFEGFQVVAVGLVENERPKESWMAGAREFAFLFGFQYSL